MDSEESWRKWINEWMPELDDLGQGPIPTELAGEEIESNTPVPTPKTQKGKLFVQKIVTEIYLYTDEDGRQFGTETFQDLHIIGFKTSNQMLRMIEREKTRRAKRSQQES